jgi:pimeloyl-ACP methyl ester carboxylesterase
LIKKLTLIVAGFLLLAAVVLFGWYQIDGQPLAETRQFFSSQHYSVDIDDDGSLLFLPAAKNGYGLLIMHGALIKPQSYTNTAGYFAERGYTVFLPYGFARLSITAVNSAASRMAELDLAGWFVIGHSMGGLSSMILASEHALPVKAVALWASAIPSDYSHVDFPILNLWGDHDGLIPAERYAASRQNLPESTRYITVEGGNHQNFAMYSHQFFEAEPKIGWREQIDFANETTAAFFAETIDSGR